MANVPTSGPWQTDQTLMQLLHAAAAEQANSHSRAPNGGPATRAYAQYLDANRARLGIPDGYGPSLRNGGQTLDKDFSWRPLITGAATIAGGLALPALFGSGTVAGAAGASEAAGGVLPATTPVPLSSVALSPPGFAGAGGLAGGGGIGAAAGATAAGSSVIDKIIKAATSPGEIATLATLLPSLIGGGHSSPFGDVNVSDELSKTLALQRGRMEQAQPVYDTLVNMAYGMSPTRSRGSAPAGYTPNPAPSGAYQFEAPRFGGG